ncbi:MAG: PEP-CTERM sorting domain-containing protein [Pseudomonadota bacterium]
MRIHRALCSASVLLLIAANHAGAVTITTDVSVSANSPGGIQTAVDSFRSQLGTDNGGAPVNGDPNGHREIDWDDAPDSASDPNALPGDFFNSASDPQSFGVEFQATGSTTDFLLSSTQASGTPIEFGEDNNFVPFSDERIFSPINGTTFDILFFDPADQTTQATTGAFGIVFLDVEAVSPSASIQLFDIDDNLLATRNAVRAENGGASFIGLIFDEAVIARVSVQSGTAPLLSNLTRGPGSDGVAVDNLIFGEPVAVTAVPLPTGLILMISMIGGIAAAGTARRRSA